MSVSERPRAAVLITGSELLTGVIADRIGLLPQRLAAWEQERTQLLADGRDPVPAYIRAASWDERFASGSQAMEDKENFIAA